MSSNSTFSNSTARSYALALYELSKENSELDKVESDVKDLKQLLSKSRDLNEAILNPTISKEEKEKVLSLITKKKNYCENLKKFLGFVASKNRLFYLSTL